MSEARTVTAALVVIGNEILSGRTKDANLPYLAERLNALGVQLREARVVPDVEAEIVDAVNACRARHDYVFTTGGIGPTHDDITAMSVAKAFGVALELNAEAVRRLKAHYDGRVELNEARLRMAHIPAGATLIDNPVSAAPGFQIANVLVMAGVPSIMQAMFEGVSHRLVGGRPLLSRTVSCGLAEGTLAAGLGDLQGRYPDLDIGSYPHFRAGQFGVAIVLRGPDADYLDEAVAELTALMRGLGGTPVVESPA
ncbi:MAG TPA: competence/damage-inducible protein A [Alphaproteobacteria bacterium]|nr:competence/damage-inducible protein A [Alphaproteobacteria bacterium]